MFSKIVNWYTDDPLRRIAIFYAVLFALGFIGFFMINSSQAATVSGTFTYPTTYCLLLPDGVTSDCTKAGDPLPLANIANVTVEAGTCSAGVFSTKEGQVAVAPPLTTWAVTVARQFGDFCVRALTTTTLGTQSPYIGTVKVTKVEPKPMPPLLTASSIAWEMKPNGLRYAGTAPIGTACSGSPLYVDDTGSYYAIPRDAVSPLPVKGMKQIVALCAAPAA